MDCTIKAKLIRGLYLVSTLALVAALLSSCVKKREEEKGNPLDLINLLNCLGSCGDPAVNTEFSNPTKVTITGYTGHAMEPFITRDGSYLFFNSLNDGQDTSIYYATRDSDTEFTNQGKINGVNGTTPPHLDAVASMDTVNTGSGYSFYYISTRDWPANFHNVMTGTFAAGTITGLAHLDGDFYIESAGWIIMDGEISPNGNDFYFVNAHFSGGAVPDKSDIGIALKSGSVFNKYPNSETLMASVNTSRCLEYAPSIRDNGLELFFTRLQLCPVKSEILVAKRASTADPFGAPERIGAITGFAEAPSLSGDSKKLYYHRKDNGVYAIYMVSRP